MSARSSKKGYFFFGFWIFASPPKFASSREIKKWGFKSKFRLFVGRIGNYNIGNKQVPCSEINSIVVGNSTISFEETIECRIMNLLVKIFIDQDPFREVLGFVRRLNLSVFDLLITLKESIIPKYSSLTKLIADFVEKTKKPLL